MMRFYVIIIDTVKYDIDSELSAIGQSVQPFDIPWPQRRRARRARRRTTTFGEFLVLTS